jgi:hypothetical protein
VRICDLPIPIAAPLKLHQVGEIANPQRKNLTARRGLATRWQQTECNPRATRPTPFASSIGPGALIEVQQAAERGKKSASRLEACLQRMKLWVVGIEFTPHFEPSVGGIVQS